MGNIIYKEFMDYDYRHTNDGRIYNDIISTNKIYNLHLVGYGYNFKAKEHIYSSRLFQSSFLKNPPNIDIYALLMNRSLAPGVHCDKIVVALWKYRSNVIKIDLYTKNGHKFYMMPDCNDDSFCGSLIDIVMNNYNAMYHKRIGSCFDLLK